jgi:glutamyl-Q tRNA(Asp) synthetase
MQEGPPVLRFAPSPNGYLHMGHAYSALLNHRLAQKLGGRFLLRIEDIDKGRARPEYERGIFEDLAWLGLDWPRPARRQSDHMDDYAAALARLDHMGLLYPCFASRREMAQAARERGMARNPDGAPLYPGLYRDYPREKARERIANGEPYALRLDMKKAVEMALAKSSDGISFIEWRPAGWAGRGEEERRITRADPMAWGDVIIARKDVKTSYALAVTVDDALQGVTHVVRGMDLFHATAIQRLLQILLDLPAPLYFHHRLVLDNEMRKLSKSRNHTSLRDLRRAGLRPCELLLQLPPLHIE